MTSDRSRRGSIVVAPLVGATLGLVVLAGLTVALAEGARWLVRADRRAETHDTADLVTQAFAFDVRSAGWDPTGASGARLEHATPSELEVRLDRDGDGAIDTSSAERVRWSWAPSGRTLSRIVGGQSMPLASTAVRAAFEYRDETGTTIVAPASGLGRGDLARVRSVALSFTLASPGGGAPVERTTTVAMRGGAS